MHWNGRLTDVSRTGRFPPDDSRTHLVRESSLWKCAFIVTSANNILSLIQLCEHSLLTVNLNTLTLHQRDFDFAQWSLSVHLGSAFF